MDAFFASVEQLDNPKLYGKPIAVGGKNERGVVAAASYEARKFGVRSAMSTKLAKKLCPELIFVKVRHERYKEISMKIRDIFYSYTDLVEPLSLDEAFLDVTHNKKNISSATKIAEEIRHRIKKETGLTASAGISINKFVAKIASDINKPNGQKLIKPSEVIEFLEQLSIDDFFGIGKVTASKMKGHGIFVGLDLKKKSLAELVKWFGKSGEKFYNIVRAKNNSPVIPNRRRKSVGVERTFFKDIFTKDELKEKLLEIVNELEFRLQKTKLKGRTITLKYKYTNFEIHTKSITVSEYISTKKEILDVSSKLLDNQEFNYSLRLMGVTVSNLDNIISENTRECIQLKFNF